MKRTVVMMSAVLLAFGADAQAQQQKSASGPAMRATLDGSGSVAVPGQPTSNTLRSVPISATLGGSSTAVNPSPPTGNLTVTVDISGVDSWDGLGSAANSLLSDAGGGVGGLMTGIGWDVSISTVGASWLSEATIYFDGSDLDLSGLFLTPGSADGFPGTASYSSGGIVDLSGAGIPDIPVRVDGLIHMEFFESFDDASGAIDATYGAGSTLDLVYHHVVDISGVDSFDGLGAAGNTLLTNDDGATGSVMSGIGWDVSIATVGASWLSEATVYFDGSDLDLSGLFLTPGSADGFPGTASYSSGGIVDLSDAGIPNIPVLVDGLIHMEFFESFDDASGAVDATYGVGSTLDLVYLECGTVTDLGGGCAGNGGFTPAMSATGCMYLGETVDLSVADMDGGAPYAVVTGFSLSATTFPNGCLLDVAIDHFLFLGLTPGAGAGGGAASFSVTIPVAGTFYQQFVVVDSVTGKTTSNALEIVINP